MEQETIDKKHEYPPILTDKLEEETIGKKIMNISPSQRTSSSMKTILKY